MGHPASEPTVLTMSYQPQHVREDDGCLSPAGGTVFRPIQFGAPVCDSHLNVAFSPLGIHFHLQRYKKMLLQCCICIYVENEYLSFEGM